MGARLVQRTPELRRVAALPRRDWTDAEAAALVEELTAILRTPDGRMSLRPVQAIALVELGCTGGLFATVRVGGGKTLLSMLAPCMVGAARPLLLIPAKLRDKTCRARDALRVHWQLPEFMRIETFELLGRPQAAQMLVDYNPDLILADEGHRLKNPRAAVTRRVMRHLGNVSGCKLGVMSGTITKRSLRDYAHLLVRALGAGAPLPRSWSELEAWADVIDERPNADERPAPGALLDFAQPEDGDDPWTAARRGYRRRLVQSPGVITSGESTIGCSLSITAVSPAAHAPTRAAFRQLRADWELPDGTQLADGLAIWRHARELALGFFYRWTPPGPREWVDARREWASACRDILTHNRRDLDSEFQVAQAVGRGLYPQASEALARWRAVKDSFTPNTVPVWLDDFVLDACASWARGGSGIIWCEHRAFAEELARRTGLPYYGAEGKDARGRPIPEQGMDGTGDGVVIASIASNRDGRNLQAWSRNLVVSPPANGEAWEQLLGRTHRDGTEADEVTADVLVTCAEHADGWRRAVGQATYTQDTLGQPQKILYADVDMPAGPEGLL